MILPHTIFIKRCFCSYDVSLLVLYFNENVRVNLLSFERRIKGNFAATATANPYSSTSLSHIKPRVAELRRSYTSLDNLNRQAPNFELLASQAFVNT